MGDAGAAAGADPQRADPAASPSAPSSPASSSSGPGPRARRRAKVRDYMTTRVVTIPSDVTVREAIAKVTAELHVGLPVVDEGDHLVGFVTAKQLLRHVDEQDRPLMEVIRSGTPVATPEMNLDDAARVLFRLGIKDLPVVENGDRLVGIISTADVIRSHIERTDPEKALKLKDTLEALHGIKVRTARRTVPIEDLRPTQGEIFEDEIEGRVYELRKGLAEPIIVIEKPGRRLLVDGHHRVIAARRIGMTDLDALALLLDEEVELGMERSARAQGLHTLDDIHINATSQHPLPEVTERLLRRARRPGEAKEAAEEADGAVEDRGVPRERAGEPE